MGNLTRLRNIVRGGVAALALGALTACTPMMRNHGYTPSDSELAEIVVGADTRASVEDAIGTPTIGGVLNERGFYYVSSRWRHFGFLAPEIVDRQVVAISFDSAGVVSNVERFTLEDGRVVPLSRRVTDSNVRNTTFLRQLMGNLGRFDAGTVLGDPGGNDGL